MVKYGEIMEKCGIVQQVMSQYQRLRDENG
jgi:hypothetical protein